MVFIATPHPSNVGKLGDGRCTLEPILPLTNSATTMMHAFIILQVERSNRSLSEEVLLAGNQRFSRPRSFSTPVGELFSLERLRWPKEPSLLSHFDM